MCYTALQFVLVSLALAECDFTAVDFEEKTALHWTASNPDPSCIQVIAEIYPSLLNKQSVLKSSAS